jgi:hypothetical protein
MYWYDWHGSADWKIVPLIFGQPVGTGPTVVEDGTDELVDVDSVGLDIELVENRIEDELDEKELENQLKDIDADELVGELVGE